MEPVTIEEIDAFEKACSIDSHMVISVRFRRLMDMARAWHKQKEELKLIKFELDTRLSERDMVRKFLKETESENACLKAELEAANTEIERLAKLNESDNDLWRKMSISDREEIDRLQQENTDLKNKDRG